MKKRSEAIRQANLQARTERLILILLTLLLAAVFVSTSKAESSIDPISQIYFVTETDQVGSLGLKRTYSSASTFRGHFGVGWCSELDARIRVYSADEIRYRGCDLENANALEPRQAASKVVRGAFGFRRPREDGATQFFSREGHLDRIVRPDGEIRIVRDDRARPREIVFKLGKSNVERKVAIVTIDTENSDDDLLLITGLDRLVFQFKDAMLVRTQNSRFAYDDDFNLTQRLTDSASESIEYDSKEDRVTRIARSTAFGRDRLLLAIARTGKSSEGGIEMKVEVERGAEMHPVRILYDRETRRLSLEGDRDVARMILKWLRS